MGISVRGFSDQQVSIWGVSVEGVSVSGVSVQRGLCHGDPSLLRLKSRWYASDWNTFLLIHLSESNGVELNFQET